MVYYNEFDPKCAAWIRESIAEGLIAKGEVDERSITEVQPSDLRGYVQCHFFAGVAGWSFAFRLAGWADDRPVWSASLPCQPWSIAGQGAGAADDRNLWGAYFRLVRELKPEHQFGEQVEAAIKLGWLDGVSTDLEAEGYTFGAVVLPAACVGAPNPRHRIFWVAHSKIGGFRNQRGESISRNSGYVDGGITPCRLVLSDGDGCESGRESTQTPRLRNSAEPNGRDESFRLEHARSGREELDRSAITVQSQQRGAPNSGAWSDYRIIHFTDGKSRRIESSIEPVVAGIPKGILRVCDPGLPFHPAEARTMRLRGYGNAINPICAAEFIKAYNSL